MTGGATLRLAGPDDAGALRSLRLAWATEKGVETGDPTFEDRFAEWLAHESEHRLFWIAECDDEPVGMVNLMVFRRMPYPDGTDFKGAWGYLGNLFVSPQRRGRGIGESLVAACTTYADANDFARIVLVSNSDLTAPD